MSEISGDPPPWEMGCDAGVDPGDGLSGPSVDDEPEVFSPERLEADAIRLAELERCEAELGRVKVAMMEAAGLPPVLQKAVDDYFEYVLGTKSGLVISFRRASFSSKNPTYVHLDEDGLRFHKGIPTDIPADWGLVFRFQRGIDIRVDDIAWCADGGHY